VTPTETRVFIPDDIAPRSRHLTPPVAEQIDQALARVGQFGEVRLIVVKGRVRFVEIVFSEEAAGGGAHADA
jgi:hypothetical protein